MTNDDTPEPAPTAEAVLEGLREAVRLWEDYREATTPIGQAGALTGFANAFFHVADALAEHDAAPARARRLWCVFDGEDLVGVYAREQSARLARSAHAATVRSSLLGERWRGWTDAHVVVTWRELLD